MKFWPTRHSAKRPPAFPTSGSSAQAPCRQKPGLREAPLTSLREDPTGRDAKAAGAGWWEGPVAGRKPLFQKPQNHHETDTTCL